MLRVVCGVSMRICLEAPVACSAKVATPSVDVAWMFRSAGSSFGGTIFALTFSNVAILQACPVCRRAGNSGFGNESLLESGNPPGQCTVSHPYMNTLTRVSAMSNKKGKRVGVWSYGGLKLESCRSPKF